MIRYMEAAKSLSKIFILVTCVSCVNAKSEYHNIKMSIGVMQRTSTQAVVVEETTDIPFITKEVDPDYGFGYRIEFNNDSPYQHKAIIRVPSKTILTGETPAIINETDSYRIVSYPEESVTEFYHLFIRLSEEDPSGLYIVESYINRKLFRVIEFNVLEKMD